MRPSLIPNRNKFPSSLIRRLYEAFRGRCKVEIHLMTKNPLDIINEINDSIELKERGDINIIVQREAYNSQDEVIEELEEISSMGYGAGLSLNLITPLNQLTNDMIRKSDFILLMTVPMGYGGQPYAKSATERIMTVSSKFPNTLIEVDGGINDHTIKIAKDAGAKRFVVGSFITRSDKPKEAVKKLWRSLQNF